MAGKELKATEKTVLKHSRDGVMEKNLASSSEKRVSKRTEDAVLKAETPSDMRFDKLKAAGIAPVEPTKRRSRNLRFGRNNSENNWEQQRAEAKAEMAEQTSPSHKPRPPEQQSRATDYEFTSHSSEQFTTSEQPLSVTAQEFKESLDFNFKGDNSKPVSALKEEKPSKLKSVKDRNSLQEHSSATKTLSDKKSDTSYFAECKAPKPTLLKRQFTENSPNEQYSLSDNPVEVSAEELRSAVTSEEYTTSDKTVSVSADELQNYGEDYDFMNNAPKEERSKDDLSLEKEKKPSKLKENKVRNTLQKHSSAAEKLTAEENDSALNFESDTPSETDTKTRRLEKRVEKAEKRLTKLEEKNDKKLPKLVKKDEKRVYRLEKRITKAESKLPQQRVFHVRKEFNPEKQKMQRKLKLEKEAKQLNRGGIATKGIKKVNSTVSLTISGAVHSEISKYEQDDTTLKAAHGAEKVAESALHFTKESVKAHHQRLKEKPYEKVSKLKFQRESTAQKLNEHKAMTNNKKLRKDENSARKALKKSQQKLQRHNTQKKAAQTASKKAKQAAEKAGRAIVKTIASNKAVIIVIIIVLLLIGLVGTLGSALLSSVSETGGMIIGSTYTSEDEDIYAANEYMTSLENQLNNEISNIPNNYVGWNEYNYDIDPIGHDPYALTSYLTAMELAYEFDDATKARIQELFNALYTLNIESVHEVRSYQYTEIDEEGNEIIVTVYYDYYILNVTLTANDWDTIVKPKLEAAGVYDLYLLLQENKGNKPDLF